MMPLSAANSYKVVMDTLVQEREHFVLSYLIIIKSSDNFILTHCVLVTPYGDID